MLSDVMVGLRWNASLGVKFLRVVPYSTLAIVLLTLVSQIAMLLASFLPLKVIIMLGAESTPSYFPVFLAALERSVLIGILSAGTAGFFLVHFACERMIESATGYATTRLLANSQKMVLFENQEALAASSYQRYSRALASGVFTGLALLGLAWFYPEMSMIMLVYFVLVLLLLWQGSNYSAGIRERLESRLVQLMNVVATVGFFVAFGYLVIDFVFFAPPGVIVALIAFLLIRQAMQRAAGMIADLTFLYRQKPRLNALFFHGQIFHPLQIDPKKSLWPLLMPEARQAWVAEVMNTVVGEDFGGLEACWHQLGNPTVVGLRVIRGKKQYLLKLYEPNRSSLALNEADLMTERPKHLPSARWVGTVPVDKFLCLVYQLPPGERPEPSKVGVLAQALRAAMIATSPRPEVIQRYMRSKAMLWQRLDQEILERLELAATTADQQHNLVVLLAQLPVLHKWLEALPLTVFNAEMNQDTIWLPVVEEGGVAEPILLNWGTWVLEPIGAGWPEADNYLGKLDDALTTGAAKRPELTNVKVEQVQLAALAFALERECARQRYNEALELIPRILERMVALEVQDSSRNVNAG